MIEELARHIKVLLAENDCVILPELGGFMAQYVPACHIPEENMFMPPCRKVTFNTQLSLNDGLLVQAYMQAYDTNYPKALGMMNEAVSALRNQLAQEGEAKLQGIGTLRVTLDSRVEFVPEDQEILSPALYGFSSFEMLPLSEIAAKKEPTVSEPEKKNAVVISINRQWLNTAVAAVVAIVLFFAWSAPVDNTYVEPENYAFLGDVRFFDNIRSQSVATSPVQTTIRSKAVAAAPTKHTKEVVAPKEEIITLKEEAEASDNQPALQAEQTTLQDQQAEQATSQDERAEQTVPEAEQAQPQEVKDAAALATQPEKVQKTVAPKSNKRYHIIVASATSKAEADKTLRYFESQGHPEVYTLGSEGRIRIVLQSFDNMSEATAKCNEVRNQELFSTAWVYVSRN